MKDPIIFLYFVLLLVLAANASENSSYLKKKIDELEANIIKACKK